MAEGDQDDKRAQKRGRRKVAEAGRVRADAEAYASVARPPVPLLPGLVGAGESLPDDERPHGPGRPVGARATAPAEYRRYILATRGDFIGRLAGIANADTLELARVLMCKPLEALQIQAKLGQVAAPYVYQAQQRPPEAPPAGYYAGLLVVPGYQPASSPSSAGAAIAGAMDALAALAGRPPDIEEIQALTVDESAVSEPANSEREEKAP